MRRNNTIRLHSVNYTPPSYRTRRFSPTTTDGLTRSQETAILLLLPHQRTDRKSYIKSLYIQFRSCRCLYQEHPHVANQRLASGCYLHHGFLLITTVAHYKISAALLCRLHLYLTYQHQAMAFSSNSRYCSPPAPKMMILVGTFHGQEHAGMCMTSYQLADLLQLHPWGLL